MKKEIKFDIQDLLPIGMVFVVLGIALAYGLNVMEDVQTDMVPTGNACLTNTSQCTAAYNATGDAITGVGKLPEKLPLIATVVVAAVIIGIIVRYLYVKYA